MTIEPRPELGACIIASRRAAAAVLLETAGAVGLGYSGVQPDRMLDERSSRLAVFGFDITAGIDAAVLEALAWKPVAPPPAPPAPRRRWWQFSTWRFR